MMTSNNKKPQPLPVTHTTPAPPQRHSQAHPPAKEINGPKGLEPTRYGDWERNGRCSDF